MQLTGRVVTLRPVAPADAGALRTIHATPEVAAWWGAPGPAFPADADQWTTRLAMDRGGEVVGMIDLSEEDDPDYRYAAIDLFVAPSHHRQGIASDAIRTAIGHLRAKGHHRITIDPAVDNHAAVRCYAALGFRRVGVMRSSWRDTSTDRWRDGLLMELVEGIPPPTPASAPPVPERHRAFAEQARQAGATDPLPTFRALSEETGVPVDDLVHLALVRWASAGSEALMAMEPQALRDLIAARRREDWQAVAGIVDWLEAGLD